MNDEGIIAEILVGQVTNQEIAIALARKVDKPIDVADNLIVITSGSTFIPSIYNTGSLTGGESEIPFTSSSLTGSILSITHGLDKMRISAVAVYDNNNKKIPDANYEYTSITSNTGNIEFFLPITTGTWYVKLK